MYAHNVCPHACICTQHTHTPTTTPQPFSLYFNFVPGSDTADVGFGVPRGTAAETAILAADRAREDVMAAKRERVAMSGYTHGHTSAPPAHNLTKYVLGEVD